MESSTRLAPIIGLITAESLSLLGNQIAAVAIPVLVLQFTNSPLVTAIASAGNVVPIILAAILGGRAIDRFGAWRISVSADLLSFFSVLALPLAFTYFDQVSPLAIFLLVFLGAVFDPTGVSARQTLVPELVKLSGKPLHTINSWRGGLENGADFLGPVIGAALISLAGVIATFFINAATFLICAGIFSITVPAKQRLLSPENEIDNTDAGLSGLTFIFKHNRLRSLAIIGSIANLAILPFLGLLLPVLATQKFKSTALLGICLSVFGLAATIGAASFSRLVKRFSHSTIYYGGLIITGSSILLCAFANNRLEVIFASALAGLLLGAGNPLQQTILHQETPEAIAGKVFTSLTAIHFLAGPLGLLMTGIVAEFMNVEITFMLAGGLLLVAAILGWVSLPLAAINKHSTDES